MRILTAASGGLGHRYSCIDACLSFGRAVGAEVEVLWFRNEHLNCRFDQLFEPPEGARLTEVGKWNEFLEYQAEFDATHLLDNEWFNREAPTANYWRAETFGPDARLSFKTFHRFHAPRRGVTYLSPKRAIAVQVEQNFSLVDKKLGVHVRRTDHSYAIKQSETAEYFALLDARPPEERFFLCTDDPREEEMFQQRYPGRIQSYPKRDLDRRKPEAIEDALIDLLLLSRCTAVVASDGSLFSSCAAFIGNVLLHRVKS
ncbi:MAG: hypothetical protein ACI9KS_000348 [Sulfitobacter sp.]|jgi:hypothetical protein